MFYEASKVLIPYPSGFIQYTAQKMNENLTHQNPYGYKFAAVEPLAENGGTEAILGNGGE